LNIVECQDKVQVSASSFSRKDGRSQDIYKIHLTFVYGQISQGNPSVSKEFLFPSAARPNLRLRPKKTKTANKIN
jgi:hypothetical protein